MDTMWNMGHVPMGPWGIEIMGLWDYEILAHDNFGPYDYMAKGTLVCLLKEFFIWKDTHGPNLAVYYDKNIYTNAVEGILNSNAMRYVSKQVRFSNRSCGVGWQNWGWHRSPCSRGWQKFISFHCGCLPSLCRGLESKTKIWDKIWDRQTDRHTHSGVYRVASQLKMF